jgi:hypothetical protein
LREQTKDNQKKCMPLFYCPRRCVSKVVSIRRNRATGKEGDIAVTRG